MKTFYVYLLSNKHNTTLYVGFTNDLRRRVSEHKNKNISGFTSKYNVNKLVYYEEFEDSYEAFSREQKLKKWNRQWKVDLIEKDNPGWLDLSEEWFED